MARDLLADRATRTGRLLTQAGWPGLEIAGVTRRRARCRSPKPPSSPRNWDAPRPAAAISASASAIGALLALPAGDHRDAALSAAAEGTDLPVAVVDTEAVGACRRVHAGLRRQSARRAPISCPTPPRRPGCWCSPPTPPARRCWSIWTRPRAGLTITGRPTLDDTRRLATVTADGARPGQVWPFPATRCAARRRGRRERSPSTASAWPRRCSPPPSTTSGSATSSAVPSDRFRPSSTRAPTCWSRSG